jgi:hypothetical protein
VDGDHTHPDEGGVPKTPEEGDAHKSLDRKISKKLFQRTSLTFQAETSAGMTKDQLAEPAGKEPKTTINSASTAKTDKYEVEKEEAEPPAVSKPAILMSDKPTNAMTYMKKVQEEELIKSTMLTRLMVLDTKSSPMINTDPPDLNVTTNTAPPTEVTSEASMETTLTPTAAEKTPAEDKSEEAEEEAADEPMRTFTKPVIEDTPANDTPPPHVATEASHILEPGGPKPALVVQEQNRKTTKNNQAAQVQETFSKVGASLTNDDDAFTERASPCNQTTSVQGLLTPKYPTYLRQLLMLLTDPKLLNPVPMLPKPI